ncbi:hydroxyethylthiazole kinase [Atopobium sp. oral taxon 416]|uniref:hydroxyethylthiazole kinase n=1 Tax=Atopobium sp. oral taxon 416 TaxID=712157 RepID=UPI001BA77E69|nr:hydroxyethylthiazole kinase [Atopobium sp. oral taxon 416]QUC04485.1 hydroxyethylthiazole kinase [Atopobium sp. oral taxon 416]
MCAQVVVGFANELHKPSVLDPVVVGSPSRKKINLTLLIKYQFSAIHVDAGEIAAIVGAEWESRGIDADTGSVDVEALAQTVAQKYHALVMLSGAIDYVSDGVNLLKNEQSEPMLTVNVGSGDILSSTLGACLAVSSDSCSAGIVTARILTCARAKAVQYSHSLGSWMVWFFDELTTIDSAAIQEGYNNDQ